MTDLTLERIESLQRSLDAAANRINELDAIRELVDGFAEEDGDEGVVGKVRELIRCHQEATKDLDAAMAKLERVRRVDPLAIPCRYCSARSGEMCFKSKPIEPCNTHISRWRDAIAKALEDPE